MKILLIGKNGQLGQALCQLVNNFPISLYPYSKEELDVTNRKQLEKVVNKIHPEIIINTSAYHVVKDCERYPEVAFAVNTLAIKNLADICNKKRIILVTYSTDYVFDGREGKPYLEDDHTNPLQIYGLSKLAGELIALNYNHRSLVIRTCGLYAGLTGSRAKKGNFVLYILKEAKKRKKLEIAGDQIVSPTYAFHLARATLQLILKKPAHGIYHLVNEGYCSWAEFAEEIVRITRSSLKIEYTNRGEYYDNLRRPLFSALENKKAKNLGVSLPSWKDGLEEYLDEILK